MPTIPVGYAQINYRFSGVSAPEGAEVTIGVDVGAPGNPASVGALAAANWEESFLQGQSSTVTLDSVLVKFGPNATGPSAEVSVGVAGDSGGSAQPPQVAILVRKVTDLGGRAGRGRFYIPGLTETLVDDGGVIGSTSLAIWQGLADDYLSKMLADSLEPVVLHGPDSPLTEPTPILELQVDQKVATQRRRLRG